MKSGYVCPGVQAYRRYEFDKRARLLLVGQNPLIVSVDKVMPIELVNLAQLVNHVRLCKKGLCQPGPDVSPYDFPIEPSTGSVNVKIGFNGLLIIRLTALLRLSVALKEVYVLLCKVP